MISLSVNSSITLFKMAAEQETICVICQDILAQNANKICLPCAHNFHTSCITEYIHNKAQQKASIDCPVCRTDHFKYNDEYYKEILHMLHIDIPTDAVAINTSELMRRHSILQQNFIDVHANGSQSSSTKCHVDKRYVLLVVILTVVLISLVIAFAKF